MVKKFSSSLFGLEYHESIAIAKKISINNNEFFYPIYKISLLSSESGDVFSASIIPLSFIITQIKPKNTEYSIYFFNTLDNKYTEKILKIFVKKVF
jgi:hypothetical protein